jgi:hypothetical protein
MDNQLPAVTETEILNELRFMTGMALKGYIPKDQLLEHIDRVEGHISTRKALLRTLRDELHPASG